MTLSDPVSDEAIAAGSPDGQALSGSHWRARWVGVIVVIAAFFTPIVSYAGQLGLAPLAALGGLFCLPLLGRRTRPTAGVAILLALVVWELVSMSWSIAAPVHPDFHRYKSVEALTGIKLVFELALYGTLVLAARTLDEGASRLAGLVLAVGLCAMCAVMSVDALTHGAFYRAVRIAFHQKDQLDLIRRNAARGCYTAALLFWPAMLRLRQSFLPIWQGVLAVGLIVAAVGLQVDAPLVALVVSSIAYVAVRRFGRGAIWGLLGATVAYFALAPVLVNLAFPRPPAMEATNGVLKASWFARADIWRFVSGEIPTHPLLGWGMDASRMWPNLIPLHPHNAALQVWLELGAVGVAIVTLFWAWLWDRIARLCEADRGAGAAAAAVAVAYLVIGALSFGVWQEWWLGLGALSIVFCRALARGREGVAHDPAEGLIELTPLGETA